MTVSAMGLCRGVQITAAVALAGVAVGRLLAQGTDLADGRAWNRLAVGSWVTLTAASVLQLGLTAAAMSGLPSAQSLSADVLGEVLAHTSYGAAWRVRMCLLAGGLVWLGLGPITARFGVNGKSVTTGLNVAGAVLSAALLASLVWTGHAASAISRARWWPVGVLHAVAAGTWPGGLLPLAWMLARAGDDLRLIPAAMTVTRRFSRLSVVAVLTLAGSGLVNAGGLIGWSAAGWTGPYGRLVWCKLVLFAVMVALGAANRRLIRRAGPGENPRTIRRLLRHVALECVLAVLVLAASEALAMTAPPTAKL